MSELDVLKSLVEAGEKFNSDPVYTGEPNNEEHARSGLCQCCNGIESGIFPVISEWHEGRFFAEAANAREVIKWAVETLDIQTNVAKRFDPQFVIAQAAAIDKLRGFVDLVMGFGDCENAQQYWGQIELAAIALKGKEND